MDPQDPPFEPFPGTKVWYESDGAVLSEDAELTNLMVRVGMAANAIGAQLHLVRGMSKRSGAVQVLLTHSAMITSASLTFEALVFAGKHMPTLRNLASGVADGAEQSKAMGALLSGKHPASAVLNRARNQLGFHWDAEAIEHTLKEYARNKSVIWLEFAAGELIYHRLADEVLVSAFIPKAVGGNPDAPTLESAIADELRHVFSAMRMVSGFFATCIHGYFVRQRGQIRRRTAADIKPEGTEGSG